MPASSVTLPLTAMFPVPVTVPENPVQLIVLAPVLPVAIVTVEARHVQTTVPSVTVLPTTVGHVGSVPAVVPAVVHS